MIRYIAARDSEQPIVSIYRWKLEVLPKPSSRLLNQLHGVTFTEGSNLRIVFSFFIGYIYIPRPPLWSSGQSFWLQIQRSRVRFPALPDFLSSSGSGTGSTQPREVN